MSDQPTPPANAAPNALQDRLAKARSSLARREQIPRRENQSTCVTSFGQQRLHYLYDLFPSSTAYHLQLQCRIDGELDQQRLGSAVVETIRGHRVLHSTFATIDAELQSVVQPELIQLPQQTDLSGLPKARRERAFAEILASDNLNRFDLSSEIPVRSALIRLSDTCHSLLVTFHHIAVDERSLELFLSELANRYANSQVATQPENAVNYADFAHWDRSRTDERNRSLQFWRSQFEHPPIPIDLPTDRSASDNKSQCGRLRTVTIPAALAVRLQHLAKTHQVTPFMLQLAAFNVLLHHYSHAEVLTIGIPMSTRTRPDLRDVIGFFAETVPVRTDLSNGPSFADLLASVRGHLTEVMTHAHVPFQDIVTAINPPRSRGGNPLFNVMVVAQSPLKPLSLTPGLTLTPSLEDSGAAKFDLTLFVGDLTEHCQTTFEYNTSLFDSETIDRLVNHWLELLASIVDAPKSSIAQLNILTPRELQALEDRMTVSDSRPTPPTVVNQIEQWAIRQPDSTAASFHQKTLTYAALNSQANALASELHAIGVATDDRVALCMDRSLELPVAILGILKSGAAYVPLNPSHPDTRLGQIMHSAKPGAIVTSNEMAHRFQEFDCPVIVLSSLPDPQASSNPHHARADGLAYVIYTSGSTGDPKGVEITHENLAASTHARFNYYSKNPSRFLLLSPYSFDSSVAGIFWTLCSGGTLVLPKPKIEHDVAALADYISSQQITHSLCLPSLYEVLLDHAPPGTLGSLHNVIVAGEACAGTIVVKHYERLPETELHNEYGPTEATVWSTVHRCEPTDSNIVPIGKPVPGTTLCLLDRRGRPVPRGVVGEIHVGGSQVARGYHQQPELSAQTFIVSPLFPGTRLYRTGDLAREQSNGSLVFFGRVDNQIKIRGHRIEAGEIEAALQSTLGIRGAVVSDLLTQTHLPTDVDSLTLAMQRLSPEAAAELLSEAQRRSSELPCVDGEVQVNRRAGPIHISLGLPHDNYIATPRVRQRKWLLEQVLQEVTSDIEHLREIAKNFVSGDPSPHVPHDISIAKLTEQEIMEDWQTPLMKSMARYATESHGDLLEIGFGRGVSATMLQDFGVRSHTIIEANPHSISEHFVPWRARYPQQAVSMIEGRWQDVLGQLQTYDSVFFHAFPLNESEFIEYIAESATFAEHFFETAAQLLREGGVFTYLTTEVDSLSRRHQRSLFKYFREVRMHVEPLSVPQDTRDAWWADSMIVLCATK